MQNFKMEHKYQIVSNEVASLTNQKQKITCTIQPGFSQPHISLLWRALCQLEGHFLVPLLGKSSLVHSPSNHQGRSAYSVLNPGIFLFTNEILQYIIDFIQILLKIQPKSNKNMYISYFNIRKLGHISRISNYHNIYTLIHAL